MNAAEKRARALAAEDLLHWEEAARLWDEAADTIPLHSASTALGQRDIQRMRERADECRSALAEEVSRG